MPEKLIPMQGCPVPTCDAEPERTLVTTEPTKLTTQNQAHERVCILPREFTFDADEGPVAAAYVTFHGDLEPITIDEPESADDTEPEPEADAANPTDAEVDDVDAIRAGDGEHDEDVADAIENAREEDARPTPPENVDLDGDRYAVYLRIYEQTHDGGTITTGEVKGKVLDADISPNATTDIIDGLVAEGYLAEPEDAVIRVAKREG